MAVAGTKGRISVMDYPHPLEKLNADGTIDLSDAYAVGIGEWDKVAIAYGYQDFPKGTDEAAALRKIGTPLAREQAIESAQSYLDEGTGFSRAGLIDQLDSPYGEGFTVALATFAVDHVQVNWNQQAVDSAKGYIAMGGFSRAGLIDQLTSSYGEQFTYAQAVYAVNKVGL